MQSTQLAKMAKNAIQSCSEKMTCDHCTGGHDKLCCTSRVLKFDYSYRDAIGGGELTGVDGFELKLLIL